MELILAFVLGILIASVIFSLVYTVTGVLKIKKQIALHKDYDDALSHNIDSVKDHLIKIIDDIKRDLHDDINQTHLDIKNLREDTYSRFDDNVLMFDRTIGNLIDALTDNINSVDAKINDLKKYIDSRIDKAVVTKKKPTIEYFTDEETQQLNS